MTKSKNRVVLSAVLAGVLLGHHKSRAADQIGLIGEFSLPDRLHSLVDSQDDYFDAVQRLQDADAAVMRARESAVKDAQTAPEYQSAVKSVDEAYQAYNDKKTSLVADMEKKDPVYNRMKSQVASVDNQIDAARQNPATTQEQFQELYKNRETFEHQWQQLEGDAMDRAGIAPLRQAWIDASKRLSDLQAKLRRDVEGTDRLKAAVAEATAASSAVEEARTAVGGGNSVDPANPPQSSAADLVYASSRSNFAGNDAWWTYGWTNLAGSKTPLASSPAK